MNDNIITIKSGVDIDSREFKDYYNKLQEQGRKFLFLDDMVQRRANLLTDPAPIDRNKMYEYKADDMAFIWQDGEIIGHRMTMLEKKRPIVNLTKGKGNHLDIGEVNKVSFHFSYLRIEFYCEYDYNLDESIRKYLEQRTYGFLEYTGELLNEQKINIKKREN